MTRRRAINLERQAGAIGDPMTIEGSLVQLSPGTRLISALTPQAVCQWGYSDLQRRGHRVHFSELQQTSCMFCMIMT
jgi:hypothetical protein